MAEKQSIIKERSFLFVLAIIRLTKQLERSYENIVIIKQIIRSVTSIGANIEEALGSNSKKEFIHSMNIAKKETRETSYWLRLLMEINSERKEEILELINENQEILYILTKIVKTSMVNSD